MPKPPWNMTSDSSKWKSMSPKKPYFPEPVLNIYPDIEYYDVTQDYFNSFEAKDYNKIKNSVTAQIRTQIEKSDLMENSRERLMVELTNLFVLTKSMGWTLMYQGEIIESPEQLDLIKR
jgi:hypothetical protein